MKKLINISFRILILLVICLYSMNINVFAATGKIDLEALSKRVSDLEAQYSKLVLDKYPVGSIYISTSSTNPGTLFGGTWEAFGQGRTLIGAGSGTDTNSTSKSFGAGTTGGEYTHKITTAEMASHTHTRGTMEIVGALNIWSDKNNAGLDSTGNASGAISHKTTSGYGSSVASGSGSWEIWGGFDFKASNGWTGATSSVGGDGYHNNIQPYIVTYMWKRTK